MRKKILILETSAFYGRKSGGSFIQADYYRKKMEKKGYIVDFYIGNKAESVFKKSITVVKMIFRTNYVIGFGSPLLDSYLQWLCFFLDKKGVFCLDTIIASIEIIKDNLNKKIFLSSLIIQNLNAFLLHNFFTIFTPPKLGLVNIASCKYVKRKLKNSKLLPTITNILYPVVPLEKRKSSIGKKKIIFYGTLYRGRGVIDLVRACRILWKKNYNFRLEIFGWPIDLLSKKTLLYESKKEEKKRILLKEKVENVRKYIKEASIVVLPFRYPCSFQTPYTLLEPMGMGVPVITTNVGSHGEWVRHGETGFICEKENPEDIARKIELVFNDKKLVKKITEGAYKLLEERYKEKDVIMDLLEKLENER